MVWHDGAVPSMSAGRSDMGNTSISATGNVVRDPEVRQLGNGVTVTKVSVAVNDRRFNKTTEAWEDVNTTFYNLTCWRMLGERVANDLRKGDPVYFRGKLQVKRYQKDAGNWDVSCDVDADVLGPDLRRASVLVKRKDRAPVVVGAPAPDERVQPVEPADVDPWAPVVARDEMDVSEPAA
jgi:single-strand DNA-binding protein